MHTDTKLPLVRLIVRLPGPVYDKLKEQSHNDAVPIAGFGPS
jgi:hypothetical protein